MANIISVYTLFKKSRKPPSKNIVLAEPSESSSDKKPQPFEHSSLEKKWLLYTIINAKGKG